MNFETEKFNNNQESPENTARSIAQGGNFNEIEKELKKKGLFDNEKTRVKEFFKERIDFSDFPTKYEALCELLTIQELHDPNTAEHGVKTYQIAKEKVEKALSGNIVLSRIIEEEGVEIERFKFACLTHDIGKIEIPHFIIKNTIKKNEWDKIFIDIIKQEQITKEMLAKFDFEPKSNPNKDELLARMKEKNLRANQIVPINMAISKEEAKELEEKWNISTDISLMDIIDKHAEFSERILREKGFPVVAEIAGQHHHKKDEESYPVAISSLQISADMADILHLADVKQALEGHRQYQQEEYSEIKVVKILIEHAYEKKIGKEIAYLWIKDEYEKLKKQDALNNLDFKEKKMQQIINDFIAKFETGDGEYKQDLDDWYKKHNRFSDNRLAA
ncbi:HD domain-containing protein [Candidatus Parcubacteria bacterium]|nr:HD domain-containing protein [Candidatus Parcubacteria bacterium]